MPGYLPESDPYVTTNRKDAERYAAGEARFYQEANDEGPIYQVEGNAHTGYSVQSRDDAWSLVIEVAECHETDCAE